MDMTKCNKFKRCPEDDGDGPCYMQYHQDIGLPAYLKYGQGEDAKSYSFTCGREEKIGDGVD